MGRAPTGFPWSLFDGRLLPGDIGDMARRVSRFCMMPPYPWGQWTYATIFRERLATLPGDVIECGVGNGGMSAFLGLLVRQAEVDKRVFAVDSFEGLPPPDATTDNAYFSAGEYGPRDASVDLVDSFRVVLATCGLGATVEPVKGFFDDVLGDVVKDRRFCLVHIDADLYGSVLSALDILYDHVVPGGIIVIDDFFHPSQGPLRALSSFANSRGLRPVLHVAFPGSVGFFVGGSEDRQTARAVDGNRYTLDWLRDEVFLRALERVADEPQDPRRRGNAELLRRVLAEPRAASSDIYDYWRSLEELWGWIDVDPGDRAPHRLGHALDAIALSRAR